MKRLVILGSGTGGTMVATKIRKRLDESEWKIIIDKDEKLYYPLEIYLYQTSILPARR